MNPKQLETSYILSMFVFYISCRSRSIGYDYVHLGIHVDLDLYILGLHVHTYIALYTVYTHYCRIVDPGASDFCHLWL